MAARKRRTKGRATARSKTATGRGMLDALQQAWVSGVGSMQGRIDSARDQAAETWDNLEALFQNRVQKALQQIGVPTGDEVRLLTQRVAELNDSVRLLASRRRAGRGRAMSPAPVRRSPRTRKRSAAR